MAGFNLQDEYAAAGPEQQAPAAEQQPQGEGLTLSADDVQAITALAQEGDLAKVGEYVIQLIGA